MWASKVNFESIVTPIDQFPPPILVNCVLLLVAYSRSGGHSCFLQLSVVYIYMGGILTALHYSIRSVHLGLLVL